MQLKSNQQNDLGPWDNQTDQLQYKANNIYPLNQNKPEILKLPLLEIKTPNSYSKTPKTSMSQDKLYKDNIYMRQNAKIPRNQNKQSFYSLNELNSMKLNLKLDQNVLKNNQDFQNQSCQTEDQQLPKISSASMIFVYSKEYEKSILRSKFNRTKPRTRKPYINLNEQVVTAIKQIQSNKVISKNQGQNYFQK